MRRLAAAIGRPVSFALTQNNADPEAWRRLLDLAAEAAAAGVADAARRCTAARCRSCSASRPSTRSSSSPAGAQTGIGLLPWQEQVARIEAEPELRGPPAAGDAGLARATPIVDAAS